MDYLDRLSHSLRPRYESDPDVYVSEVREVAKRTQPRTTSRGAPYGERATWLPGFFRKY